MGTDNYVTHVKWRLTIGISNEGALMIQHGLRGAKDKEIYI